MDGRLILSFQAAMQTGDFSQTDDGLSITGPRSSVSIHELTEEMALDEH
jgi:hypothetical protein